MRYVVDMVPVGDLYVGLVAVGVDGFPEDGEKEEGAYNQDYPFQRLFRTRVACCAVHGSMHDEQGLCRGLNQRILYYIA